jgi:hypothetical protein
MPQTDPNKVTNRFYQPGGYVGNNRFHGTVTKKDVCVSTYQSTHHHGAINTFPRSHDPLGIPLTEVTPGGASGFTTGHQTFAANQLPYTVPHRPFRTTTRDFDDSRTIAPSNFEFSEYAPQKRNFAYTKSILPPPALGVGDKLRESAPVGEPTSRSLHSIAAADHFAATRERDATGVSNQTIDTRRASTGYAKGHSSLAFHQQPPSVNHEPMVSMYKAVHQPIDETLVYPGECHTNVTQPKSGYGRLHGPFPVPQVYTQQHATNLFKSSSPPRTRSLGSTLKPTVERTLKLHEGIAFKNYGAGIVY